MPTTLLRHLFGLPPQLSEQHWLSCEHVVPFAEPVPTHAVAASCSLASLPASTRRPPSPPPPLDVLLLVHAVAETNAKSATTVLVQSVRVGDVRSFMAPS
jgi:hypothetical protein